MAALKLRTDAEKSRITRVFDVSDGILSCSKSGFIKNLWSGLVLDDGLAKRTWKGFKAVILGDDALDPLVREMIRIAVSTANECAFSVHSHTTTAKAKGMTEAQHRELLTVIDMAVQTNHLVTAMQLTINSNYGPLAR